MMTKTQIALNAIRGMEIKPGLHIDILDTMRTLKLTTEEAAELRVMVGREWRKQEFFTDLERILELAKEVTNQYARNFLYR